MSRRSSGERLTRPPGFRAVARRILVLDAPSNLGLGPASPGTFPGVYKLGWALRDQGLVGRVGGRDVGVVVPPKYDATWDGRTLRNREAIARYTRRLADRIRSWLDPEALLLVLGGDCSIVLGPMLALRRRGRYGLVFVDGHLDFRHPGNSESVGAAAGEDLALVTGRGDPKVTALDGLGPYVQDRDVCAIGFRPYDPLAGEVGGLGMGRFDSKFVHELGGREVAERTVRFLSEQGVDGYWIHLDVDVLDAALMPAVDSPEPDGVTFEELSSLLQGLVSSPGAVGVDLTVFDPDLDDDGALARPLTDALVIGLVPR
jgi:arginase